MSKCRYCSHMDLRDQNKYGECYCSYHGKYYDPDSNGCSHNDNENSGVEPGGGCYLTTAMCDILGKADDCYELETLRGFREQYLRKTEEGKSLLKEYDEISVPIASRLMEADDRIQIANEMLTQYINEAIAMINRGENEDAVEKYRSMVCYIRNLLG